MSDFVAVCLITLVIGLSISLLVARGATDLRWPSHVEWVKSGNVQQLFDRGSE